MTAERFRWLVENGRLYMPQPDQIATNDRREGTMPDAQAAWWEEVIRTAETPELADQNRRNFDRMKGFVTSFRSGWFISCWHRSDMRILRSRGFMVVTTKCADCERLVTSVAQSVAVATTFRKLEAVLPAHIELGVVRYLDYRVQGAELLNMFQFIMHKRHFYAYEAEVRAVATAATMMVPGIAEEHIRSNIVAGSYAPPVNVKAMISGIVVHPEATADFLHEIGDLCAQHGLPAPVLSGLA
jgi:hypothetical protein